MNNKTKKTLKKKNIKAKNFEKSRDFYPKQKQRKEVLLEGVIDGNARGFAFLVVEGEEKDFFISGADLSGAMHGDTVLAKEIEAKNGHLKQAKVVKIVKRGVKQLVGVFYAYKNCGFVVPDDKHFYSDVFIPERCVNGAKNGDKVLCVIESYPKDKNIEGMVKTVLGKQFDRETEVKSIAISNNLSLTFDDKVLREAKQVAKPVSAEEKSKRKDFTNLTIITIDGDDSKDFDDAISIERSGENYRLGVHIADVSHYVKENGAIDKEALERGTSSYFPELVLPMLPSNLSDDICSLMEKKDRLTLSCMMEIDKKGDVINAEIVEGVIRSTNRMTYRKVAKILDGDEALTKEYAHLVPMLFDMEALAKILQKKRQNRGNIDLDIKEASIGVDKNGKVVISEYERAFSNQIIEEFMIVANETVAEYFEYLSLPFIYRVHEKPTEEKLAKFYEFLKGLSITVKWKAENARPKDFQALLNSVKGKPTFSLINKVMLRSMQKARYCEQDLGHFGLSSKHYCHFTSPIRRYPDLMIHRIIKTFINGGLERAMEFEDKVAEIAKQSSDREKRAVEAERAVEDYYKIIYMRDYIGEEFDGIISGVTNFGVFVELPNTIEGLIKIETLKGEDFVCNEDDYTLSNGVTSYKLGSPLKVRVAGIDYGKRRVEFVLAE